MREYVAGLVPDCHLCGIHPLQIGTYTFRELSQIFEAETNQRKMDIMVADHRVARFSTFFGNMVCAYFGEDAKFEVSDFMPNYDGADPPAKKQDTPVVMSDEDQWIMATAIHAVTGGRE